MDDGWIPLSNHLPPAAARLKISMASFAAWTTAAITIVTGTAITTETGTTMAIGIATADMVRAGLIPRAAAISGRMEIPFAPSARP